MDPIDHNDITSCTAPKFSEYYLKNECSLGAGHYIGGYHWKVYRFPPKILAEQGNRRAFIARLKRKGVNHCR